MTCYYCGYKINEYCIECKDIVFCCNECYKEYSGCGYEDNEDEL